ncbi:DUF1858 domain-containing protein [Candidatus Pacearchaeota archaeon]|nr:DUF1858 domain-containing protein [Candidatus Pacearchaeota archaeon]
MKKTKPAKNLITKDMTFSSLIQKKPDAAGILFEKGMACVGCAAAANETIEQGCKAHGMNDREIKKLIEELNKK